MYQKSSFLFVLITMAILSVPAQLHQQAFEQVNSNAVRVFDASGKAFENPHLDVAGSPFFLDSWKYGNITLQNNDSYPKRPLRINFLSQQVHYLSDNNVEMALPAGLVKQVVFTDSVRFPFTQYTFQCGFLKIDNQDAASLYQVLSDGKVKMLLSTQKKIITEKNDFSGDVKEYRAYENYYFFSDSMMKRIKKNEDFVMSIFTDKSKLIEKYIEQNSLSCKSVSDIQKITDYYNSLK
jgi:hypothetical protein